MFNDTANKMVSVNLALLVTFAAVFCGVIILRLNRQIREFNQTRRAWDAPPMTEEHVARSKSGVGATIENEDAASSAAFAMAMANATRDEENLDADSADATEQVTTDSDAP